MKAPVQTKVEGRKAWYERNSGKWNGPPVMTEGANGNANSQELPRRLTSHTPKAAPNDPTIPESTQSETQSEIKGSEKITAS